MLRLDRLLIRIQTFSPGPFRRYSQADIGKTQRLLATDGSGRNHNFEGTS